MQNSITNKPAFIKDFYINTMNGLFGSKGALSSNIVGLDIDPSIVSIQMLDDSTVSLQLSPFHNVNLPEVGIQRSTSYNCYVGAEKKLFLRFRVNSDGKIAVSTSGMHMVRPNLITITQSSDELRKSNSGLLSGLKTRINEIFSPKK